MFEHLNIRVNNYFADYSDLAIPQADIDVLRRLASKVAELSQRQDMKEKRELWTRHNDLDLSVRPLILCDPEHGWNEIITDDQLECKNDLARHWEVMLRKQIFWGEELHDDFIVEAIFDVPHVYKETIWTLEGLDNSKHHTYDHDGGAYELKVVLEDYNDLDKIVEPNITVDYEKTYEVLELAKKVFDGILEVRNKTIWYWGFGLTDEFVQLRGMENLMFDFFDYPDEVHALMKRLMEGMERKLDFLEANGLFSPNADFTYVGSGGIGLTTQLPIDEPGKVLMKHMWGFAESQMTTSVSPDMFAEFIFPYQKKLMEKFGLNCYGCCEPLDPRFDIIKEVKSLRRVSVSNWANFEKMAELLKGDYVFSHKPTPSDLATGKLDLERVEKELKAKFEITKANKNRVELMMKDNHTLGKNPQVLVEWSKMAKRLVENY
jgi:hypothetical protein